jgi:hypothetical protein
MVQVHQRSVFTSLNQSGPLAARNQVDIGTRFSRENKGWLKTLKQDPLNVTKFRVQRSQILEFLDIEKLQDIAALVKDTQQRRRCSERATGLLANMFGIDGTPEEVRYRVNDYARSADAVIKSLQNKIFAPYSSHLEITNEVEITADPVDLLLMIFDDHYHKKARFEALRKLILMNLAGSIDQRERETDIETKFAHFLEFLNQHVWSKKLKIGEHEIVYLLSHHRREDFSCTDLQVLSRHEAASLNLDEGMKLTLLKRRRFSMGDHEVPIYVSVRKKPPAAKILKLLRKNEKNPAVAVDDELGLMAVLNSIADIKVFQNHLTQSATKAGSFMILEDIADTLNGGMHYGATSGSSAKTPMLKFFARVGGMRVEFILHTNRSWVNYKYMRDVAHDEYEVKRIFDSGVAELLFPHSIYFLDHSTIRNTMIQFFRQQIENSWHWQQNGSR